MQNKIEKLEKEKEDYFKTSFKNQSEIDRMKFFREKIG